MRRALVVVVALVALSCGSADKVFSAGTANAVRQTVRQICTELDRADRAAGVYLDDGGVRDAHEEREP